ncbi:MULTISPECIES: flavin reductase family protein [unclassified Kocuria]|uniref:flavin reductase family protein n=1 Tax=unclassified Kocuria TaxID=2649579 RepID=UPI00064A1810|nr:MULTISPECIES: flavin reductase family protein [unclassified Kocuria]KLU08805.1 flavin reductase [Kocuria sp. SM24M-10]OLT03264.1 flavin reductase [Kocuria sp. CNJ-770]
MRTDIPADRHGSFARAVKSLVVPRPIAWISSRSAAGVDNLAPHSFFTVASSTPTIVQFVSVGEKDSLRNIRQTGEFVVNFASAELFEQINATGTDYPPEVSEFDAVGLTREPSLTVGVPRVAESPAAIECRLHAEPMPIGDCFLVFGAVTHVAVDETALDGRGPLVQALQPIARLGRDEWGELGRIRSIRRVPYREAEPEADLP